MNRNCDLFRRNFEGQPWIKVPLVKWERVSPEVLTMEYVPGIKISDIDAIDEAGIDRKVNKRRNQGTNKSINRQPIRCLSSLIDYVFLFARSLTHFLIHSLTHGPTDRPTDRPMNTF